MPVSRHYFIQHACVSPFHGHLSTALLRLGVGLVPTAAALSLQRFLLCSKPPSAACCTLFLARCERASLRRCAIGGARSVAYGDGVRCMQAAGACGLTCVSVQRVHFWVRWGVPAEPVSFCGRRQRQQHDEGRTFLNAQTRTACRPRRSGRKSPPLSAAVAKSDGDACKKQTPPSISLIVTCKNPEDGTRLFYETFFDNRN